MLEVTIALIVSCLSTLRAVFRLKFIDSAIRDTRNMFSMHSRSQTSSVLKDFPESSVSLLFNTPDSNKGNGSIVREKTDDVESIRLERR
jgi:hypothetical protein